MNCLRGPINLYSPYTPSLICNFKDVVEHPYFYFCISGVYFGGSMIILVEIRVKGFLWKCAKKASIYGQNHRAEELPNSERYWTLLMKEKLSGII